ncbi:D-glycero-beta-D-manno-heptose 1-phosphate adenylyltransferase [Tumebacillus flagellatus]|uniref:D-glycero-beta-D-manno-heptose 1-phosphate adenylyltransferase n=1 Tax=Tumebacillus flagellatus TaxID=1157490 RepID=UPI00068B3295|nr:D-glycero-beta-D-manno-heptose 1-phosphate adenylyltransferase [Tumebacillus flagellatus]
MAGLELAPKIMSFADAASYVQEAKRSGSKVVLTNGCFDLLHRGHVEYLEFARQQGDVLLVAVNSDESVRQLKGGNRPVNCAEDRMWVLAALSSVSCVVPFETLTPEPLVALLQPDVYVKGGDYELEQLPESKIVASYGGQVVLARFVPGYSTTKILQRAQQNEVVS